MHSFDNPETINFLNKIFLLKETTTKNLKELPMEQWPAYSLSKKIISNMMYFKQIAHQDNFEYVKHGVISQQLRAVGVHSVELNYTFEPTIFGQLYEYFHWIFEIEGEDVKYKTMRTDIDKKIAQIQEEDKTYNEKPGALRYNSLLNQEENIKHIFSDLKENLPPMDDDNLTPLCALLLMDLEKMSMSRQYNFLSFQKMLNNKNPADNWTSCLTIEAIYRKPQVILKS